jgi:hypothetical protein
MRPSPNGAAGGHWAADADKTERTPGYPPGVFLCRDARLFGSAGPSDQSPSGTARRVCGLPAAVHSTFTVAGFRDVSEIEPLRSYSDISHLDLNPRRLISQP